MTTTDLVTSIRSRHTASPGHPGVVSDPAWLWCRECRTWTKEPCDALKAVEEIERLMERVSAELFRCAQLGNIINAVWDKHVEVKRILGEAPSHDQVCRLYEDLVAMGAEMIHFRAGNV